MNHSTIRFADARDPASFTGIKTRLVVTSPPYWSIKDYGVDGQVGFEQSYEAYLADLDRVWSNCWDALEPGCRMCINIGDQFLRAKDHGRYRVLPIRSRIIQSMERLGADPMGAIIWQKMTNTNTSGGGTLMGSYPHPRNGVLKIDYEFILVFKKLGKAPRPDPAVKAQAAMSIKDWSTYFTAHWNFPGERHKGHHAMFPVELPHRLIRMFTFPGETVLDPFAGACTTVRAAANLDRVGVGIELNSQFERTIRERLGPHAESVVFEGASAQSQAPSESGPFYGSHTRVEDVGRDRWKGTGKVEAVTGPIEVQVGGVRWRLEGLAAPDKAAACQARLADLVGRRKVAVEPTEDDRAYIRLMNRKLVNSTLIREGLALPDPDRSHRMRTRFLRYATQAEGGDAP